MFVVPRPRMLVERVQFALWDLSDLSFMICRLTACTPASAPGPTLGNEYGKPLSFFTFIFYTCITTGRTADLSVRTSTFFC